MSILARLDWIARNQFGFDLRRGLRSIPRLPQYLLDYCRFKKAYTGPIELRPCLHDRNQEGGSADHEYFWQDLYVARKIYIATPQKHVDIASRVDGFVAHVASFREIEIIDIRPITQAIPGVVFKQADLMLQDDRLAEYCDSLSCLHALEHFGLGRYGDPINVHGHEQGLRNMAHILRPGGVFYLSVPIGTERVEFNANRVFDPLQIAELAAANNLSLRSFAYIEPGGSLIEASLTRELVASLRRMRYALGIYSFVKQ